MPRSNTPSEQLAQQLLELFTTLKADTEPIRVLKVRAYRVGEANILIRAATQGERGSYFFGLNYISAEEIANLDSPFFAFICGSVDRTLIIPAPILISHLPRISHDRNGEYKINIDQNLNLALLGRGNRLDCSTYLNAFHLLLNPPHLHEKNSAEQSYHTVIQGRLVEIGNVRGYQTFCPNKSKLFNGKSLGTVATLKVCPQLQFSNHGLLRQIDVLWFREKGHNLIPECAFEVELSTGTWSGVGRMATLLDYSATRLYVVSDDDRKYRTVMSSLPDLEPRYRHLLTEQLSDLYAAELNLREIRTQIGL